MVGDIFTHSPPLPRPHHIKASYSPVTGSVSELNALTYFTKTIHGISSFKTTGIMQVSKEIPAYVRQYMYTFYYS